MPIAPQSSSEMVPPSITRCNNVGGLFILDISCAKSASPRHGINASGGASFTAHLNEPTQRHSFNTLFAAITPAGPMWLVSTT